MLIKKLIVSGLIFSASVSFASANTENIAPEYTSKISDKKSVAANHYMVAAANPLAVEAGYNVLKNGGSAVDALVAVQTVLGLVEPQSSGLGGGAFLVYYNAESKTISTYDGRETAPLSVTPELFQDEHGKPLKFYHAVVGGRSVGTPGTVKLLAKVHQYYGKQDWGSLLQPAIKLANNGFIISERLASAIKLSESSLKYYPDTKAYFFDSNGQPLKEGSLLVNKEYGKTLNILAKGGEEAFYKGQIAKDIVSKVQSISDNPGYLGLNDFKTYRVIERKPVCSEYRQFEICGMGPPGSGAIALSQILGILNHFDLKAMGADDPVAWQIIGDASRLAFADRGRYVADTDFVPMPQGLLDKKYLAERAALIVKGEALKAVKPGNPKWDQMITLVDDASIELPSTTHIVIVDKKGNIISMTSTIENGFGSRVMSNGFLLNNELTDFSFLSHKNGYPVANRVEPGKRPRSSMSPTIVLENGKPYMAIGSPGGSRIIGYVVQTLIAHMDWGLDIQNAISMPRMLNRFGTYELEENTEAEHFKDALEALGYEVKIRDLNSGLQGVLLIDGKLIGGADPRREGSVMGD